MKTKVLLTILMIVMIMGAMAQIPTLNLTFTAENNGQYVPLNSILIENLTQGGDTTLYAPDTVLVLDYVIGIEEASGFGGTGFSLSQNFPNSMNGKTTISLRLPQNGNVLITVSDLIGKERVNQEFQLERGIHSFTFYPGRKGLNILTVQAYDQIRTIKIFNDLSSFFSSGILKLEYNGTQIGNEDYKSGNNINNFVFNLGDQLQYTASSVLGERIIIDSPLGDKTYTYQYGSGSMPCPDTPTVTDIDGNVYNTVQIGTQCWMKENLKTTTYSNGTSISNVTDANAWSVLTTGAYNWYENDISWKDRYGALYNWFTTVDPKGLCPMGWHLPTDDEWTTLTDYIGGTSSPHGNELKSCRQVNSPLGNGCNTSEHPRWNEDSIHYGTDDYGFSGLSGGYRSSNGNFSVIGEGGFWWSTTETSSYYAYIRALGFYYNTVTVFHFTKQYGFSVRCIRD